MSGKKSIIVTGFGPFSNHKVNASWEVAKRLAGLGLDKEFNVSLILLEIPVSYEEVNKIIPEVWKCYNPVLVVHMGVSDKTPCIVIESTAHKDAYLKKDINDSCPSDGACSIGSRPCIRTGFNLNKLESDIKSECIDVVLSDNAHRYLCEYIYYTSLSIDPKRTLFLHIPVLTEEKTDLKLAEEVRVVLRCLWKQLKEREREENPEELYGSNSICQRCESTLQAT